MWPLRTVNTLIYSVEDVNMNTEFWWAHNAWELSKTPNEYKMNVLWKPHDKQVKAIRECGCRNGDTHMLHVTASAHMHSLLSH